MEYIYALVVGWLLGGCITGILYAGLAVANRKNPMYPLPTANNWKGAFQYAIMTLFIFVVAWPMFFWLLVFSVIRGIMEKR